MNDWDSILNTLAPYVPLFQTIVWIILLVLSFFLFRRQILILAHTINERIKSGAPVKAGLFELGASLQQPETVAALDGIENTNKAASESKKKGEEIELKQIRVELARVDLDSLRNRLIDLSHELAQIRGAKILWIDDNPESVLAERRLLRALGSTIVSANSSDSALGVLEVDTDFDLIITDVQRIGEFYKYNEGVRIHDGVNFIVYLRSKSKDPFVQRMPVVFYAAYDKDRLRKFTSPALKFSPEPEISNSAAELIPKVIKLLAVIRRLPIRMSSSDGKEPTTTKSRN